MLVPKQLGFKRKQSEPKVGKLHYNPLQKERLTSHIYGLVENGKKTSAKTILQDADVQRRMEHAEKVSKAEAERAWQEICRKLK